jgi:multiple sugar transport system substrate-binding protein
VRKTFVGYSEWSTNVVLPAYQKILVGDATVEQAVDEIMAGLEKAIQ